MKLPFTPQQFFEVFGRYNEAVWPIQIMFYLITVAMLFLIYKRHKYAGKISMIVLAFLWAWMGVVYHIVFFSDVNPAALLFGGMYIVQAFLFVYVGVIKDQIQLAFTKDKITSVSIFLITFALLLYQPVNALLGHHYPQTPTFGLPCPTTIFTFALLLLAMRVPSYLLIIPALWSLIGFMAAVQLDVLADWMLLISSLICVPLIILKNKKGIPIYY